MVPAFTETLPVAITVPIMAAITVPPFTGTHRMVAITVTVPVAITDAITVAITVPVDGDTAGTNPYVGLRQYDRIVRCSGNASEGREGR